MRVAIYNEPVTSNALKCGAGFLGNSSTWDITFGHNDLDACKLQLAETKLRKCARSTSGDTLALPGLSNPKSKITEVVFAVELVEANPAEEVLTVRREYAQFVSHAIFLILEGARKPGFRIGLGVIDITPVHPAPRRSVRFTRRFNEGRNVARLKWAKANTI